MTFTIISVVSLYESPLSQYRLFSSFFVWCNEVNDEITAEQAEKPSTASHANDADDALHLTVPLSVKKIVIQKGDKKLSLKSKVPNL